jgi:hypothetical protein
MAVSQRIIWEVRTTGKSYAGGGFRAAALGTDFSQQDNPQFSYTDLAIDSSINTKVTSAAFPFTGACSGNILCIPASGNGFLAGRFEVLAVSGSAAIVDRSLGVVNSTNGVGYLGGSLDHIQTLMLSGCWITSNRAFVQSGVYQTNGIIITIAGSTDPTPTNPPTQLIGYGNVRGDGIQPTILYSGSNGEIFTLNSCNGLQIDSFIFDCNKKTTSSVMTVNEFHIFIRNCLFTNFTNFAVNFTRQYGGIYHSEFTGNNNTCNRAVAVGNNHVVAFCKFHNLIFSQDIANGSIGGFIAHNQFVRCTGLISPACAINATATYVLNNIIDRMAGAGSVQTHGILTAALFFQYPYDNIITACSGYGLFFNGAAGIPSMSEFDGNVFYGNALGTRQNLNDTTINPQYGVVPYINMYDTICTQDPFRNRLIDDYELNTLPGGGGLVRERSISNSVSGVSFRTFATPGAFVSRRVPYSDMTAGIRG